MTIDNELVLDLLERSNLNWSVNKERLLLQNQHGILEDSGFSGAVRSDSRKCLATCSDRYEVFQNSEMMELALQISDHTSYKFSNGTSFKDGARVMITLNGGNRLLEYPQVGDVIEKKIELYNSHDGSGSLRIAMGSKVLTCSNGMTRFVSDKKTHVRHTANMRDMVTETLEGLELIEREYEVMFGQIDQMIDAEIKKDDLANVFEGVIREVMGVDPTSSEISQRKLNQLAELKSSMVQEVAEKGMNAWGILSGVTHYTTHKAGKDAARREQSKHGGQLLTMDNKAYDYALSLV